MVNSIKDRVLESTDIVDLVGEFVRLTPKGREHVGLCPFHDDHKPSMSVSRSKQIFKCWSCGAGGDAIRFIQLLRKLDFREALGLLADRANIEMERSPQASADASRREELRRVLEWARDHFARNLWDEAHRPALDYARSRGFSDESIRSFRLGVAPDARDALLSAAAARRIDPQLLHQAGLVSTSDDGRTYDRFRHRLIFPIADAQGRCVAFGGRALGDAPAKYLNSPESPLFSKSRILFGYDIGRAAIESAREAIVVEGYIDALLLHQAGVENVVATLGTALTSQHARLLARSADRVIMCFDGDEAGVKAADRAVETALRDRIEVRVVLMADGEDPADCVIRSGPQGFAQVLHSALGALEFKWRQTERAFAAGGAADRRGAIAAFVDFIARSSAAGGIGLLDQGMLVVRLSNLLGLSSAEVYRLLAEARAAQRRAPGNEPRAELPSDSDYRASLRSQPPGLVGAVEGLFGLVLRAPSLFGEAEDVIASVVERCPAWQRLYGAIGRALEDDGRLTLDGVMRLADTPELCELIGRCCGAAGHVSDAGGSERDMALLDALRARIAEEVNLMRLEELRRDLTLGAAADPNRGDAFRALLASTRGRCGPLGAEHRLTASGGGGRERTSGTNEKDGSGERAPSPKVESRHGVGQAGVSGAGNLHGHGV